MSKFIIFLVIVIILLSACANADTDTINTIVPSETALHLSPTDTPKPTETSTQIPPTSTPEPTITATDQPSRTPELKSEQIQVSYEDRVIRGTLIGEGELVVVLAPIYGESRTVWMPYARHFASLGYTALAFDLPGFGASTGSFSINKFGSDVTALIDYLRQERGFERFVCMGASIGGIACFDAAKVVPNLAGLVIMSSPLAPPTAEEVAGFTMPKLIIIGTEPDVVHDDVTETMKEIYNLLPEPKQFETIHAKGLSILNSEDELRDLLVKFLENLE